jgi:hypothetical protein
MIAEVKNGGAIPPLPHVPVATWCIMFMYVYYNIRATNVHLDDIHYPFIEHHHQDGA